MMSCNLFFIANIKINSSVIVGGIADQLKDGLAIADLSKNRFSKIIQRPT